MDTLALLDEARRIWNATPGGDLKAAAQPGAGAGSLLLAGDNLALMAALAKRVGAGAEEPFTLVYMDPPYFTQTEQKHYSDKWESLEHYLVMLTARILAARELLSGDGSLWLHLDRRAVHYARVMADACFGGPDHLVNEVVWLYKSGGASKRRFANKHDTLLFYAKDKRAYKFFPQEEKSYNRGLKPYRFQGVEEWQDEAGWYTLVNMKDVWEIPMVGRTARERTGYASQKPLALLERIVLSCTEAGDRCLDPFAGSGTLAAACQKHGRRWVCMDKNELAIEIAAGRIRSGGP
ncbi:MAG: site-specific DNA-methyltransferase [Clostridiales Family XIII bacterium]|jgi:DNA modification methylase|nr:site-specific DNA-methyltransferase [Clostridiales Family XIII bacterium]